MSDCFIKEELNTANNPMHQLIREKQEQPG